MEILMAAFSFLGGGAVASIVTHLFNRKKSKAEADFTTIKAAEAIIALYDKALKDLREKVERLEKQVATLSVELNNRTAEVAYLKGQLNNIGNGRTDGQSGST